MGAYKSNHSFLLTLHLPNRQDPHPAIYKFIGPIDVPPNQASQKHVKWWWHLNITTPKDPYSGRTASLNSKRFILYIYSTNIGIEYLNML